MRRLIACGLVALVAAVVGPRLVGLQSRAATTAFAYEPPPGFALAPVDVGIAEGAQAWVFDDKKNFDGSSVDKTASLARVVVHHSSTEMSIEESDLAKLATEMPQAFEASCAWVHRRHELRTRADGARVGLIEGDCNRDIDLSSLGAPSQKVRSRKLQLMFPDDRGTAIVTASYPTEQAARWEPLFEGTIASARGVATRAPATAPWTYAAWAAAGAVVGWLATAIVESRRGKDAPASQQRTLPPTNKWPRRKADDHEHEHDEHEEKDDDA